MNELPLAVVLAGSSICDSSRDGAGVEAVLLRIGVLAVRTCEDVRLGAIGGDAEDGAAGGLADTCRGCFVDHLCR